MTDQGKMCAAEITSLPVRIVWHKQEEIIGFIMAGWARLSLYKTVLLCLHLASFTFPVQMRLCSSGYHRFNPTENSCMMPLTGRAMKDDCLIIIISRASAKMYVFPYFVKITQRVKNEN